MPGINLNVVSEARTGVRGWGELSPFSEVGLWAVITLQTQW